MKKINTTVVHSCSKKAWNVVCKDIGEKYKIAIIPYVFTEDGSEILNTKNMYEALEYATFISDCFNSL